MTKMTFAEYLEDILDLQAGLMSEEEIARGSLQIWTMKLMRSGSRSQLPRGFIKGRKKPFFVGANKPHRQHKNLGQQMMADMRNAFAKAWA